MSAHVSVMPLPVSLRLCVDMCGIASSLNVLSTYTYTDTRADTYAHANAHVYTLADTHVCTNVFSHKQRPGHRRKAPPGSQE